MHLIEISLVKYLNIFNLSLIKLNSIKYNYFLILIVITLSLTVLKPTFTLINIYFIFFLKKFNYFFIKKFSFGFFKIHPIIFYGVLIYYVVLNVKNFIFIKFNNVNLSILLIISFCLGGYWNTFHLRSGRFWSKDSIEILLLMLIWINLKKIHKYINITKFLYFNFFWFLMLLIGIRFNIIYTKHNFFNFTKKKLKILNYLSNIIIFAYTITIKESYKNKIVYKHKYMTMALYGYTCAIILFNLIYNKYVHYCNKLILYLVLINLFNLLNWNYIKSLILHKSMFLLFFLFVLITTKFIYLVKFNVVAKTPMFSLNLNNNIWNKIYKYKNIINVKKYYIFKKNINIWYKGNKFTIN